MGCPLFGSPPTPDYSQSAKDQGAANLETARQQNLMNNPNMFTPYGSQTYTMGPDGRPVMTQTLDPAQQALFDKQNQAKNTSLSILNDDASNIRNALMGPFGLSGQVYQGGWMPGTDPGKAQTNLDFSGAPAMPVASDQTRQAVTNAVYDQYKRFLDPQMQQQQSNLDATLANQGIVRNPSGNPNDPNSAWQKEQTNLANQRTQAYGNAADQATQTGIGAMDTLFKEAMGSRQQGVNERTTQGQFQQAGTGINANIAQALAGLIASQRGQAYTEMANNRTMPLNMINALMSGSQIQNPTFQANTPVNIAPPPILQGAQLQGQANAADASANAGMFGGAASGLGSLLGGAAAASMGV